MKPLQLIASAAAALGILLIQPATADESPVPTVNRVLVNGTGCPHGTATVNVESDYYEVLADPFTVLKGPDLPPAAALKACTVALDLTIPPNYQFALIQVYYGGSAQIPMDMTGDVRMEYSFPLDLQFTSTDDQLVGPFDDSYETSDVFTPIWSACGGRSLLNLKTTLSLSPLADHRDATLTTEDPISGQLKQVWLVEWRPC